MGELSRLDRLFLPMDTALALSVSLFCSCNAAPAVCSPSRSPLPSSSSSSSSPPRTTRSVTRERQETNGGPRRRSPFTRHSPHDGRPPPSLLPPFHGGGQRQRDRQRGRRSEGSAARGLPARADGGYRGALARPRGRGRPPFALVFGDSHTHSAAVRSLSLSL